MESRFYGAVFVFFFMFGMPLWAKGQMANQDLAVTYSPHKARFCQTVGNDLCISPGNDIVLSLYGCATGFEDPLGFPSFEINVPPGEDLEFTITRNPDAIYNTFLIISEEAANNRFLDLCVDQDPGIFTSRFPIQASNDPNIVTQTIPSAVVDTMKAASDADGFVVMISQACPDTISTFAGVKITRFANGDSPLELDAFPEPTMDPIEVDELTYVTFEIYNDSPETQTDVNFNVRALFGNPLFVDLTFDGGTPCQALDSCTFDVLPFDVVTVTLDLAFVEPGLNILDAYLLSDGCPISTSAEIPVRPSSALQTLIAAVRAGGDSSSTVSVSNPGNQPAEVSISATDDQGRAASLVSQARVLGQSGPLRLTVQPGQTQYVDISQSSSSVQRFMVHLSSNQFVVGQVRQQFRSNQPGDVKVLGTSAAMQNYYQQVAASGTGLVPVKVVETDNKKLVVENYNVAPAVVNITVRDSASGNVIQQHTAIVTEIMGFNVIPLVAGLDENAVIEVDGGPGVIVNLEYCGPEVFQIVTMRRPSSSSKKETTKTLGSNPLAQPFYQPDVNDMRYEPSTYTQTMMSTAGAGVSAGGIDVSFDVDCGVQAASSFAVMTTGSGPGLVSEDILSPQGPLVGGFALFDQADLVSSMRWQEGARSFWILDQPPVTQGRIFMPEITPFGDPNRQVSDMAFQVMSDDALMLMAGVFDAEGQLISFQGLSLPAGGHLLCASDFGISDQAAYVEFLVPEDHPSPVWINALADQPEVLYRDQLPVLPLLDPSILSQIGDVFAAWNGSAPSCLGSAPSMADLVDFVNNNFMCPATP